VAPGVIQNTSFWPFRCLWISAWSPNPVILTSGWSARSSQRFWIRQRPRQSNEKFWDHQRKQQHWTHRHLIYFLIYLRLNLTKTLLNVYISFICHIKKMNMELWTFKIWFTYTSSLLFTTSIKTQWQCYCKFVIHISSFRIKKVAILELCTYVVSFLFVYFDAESAKNTKSQ
jgi:hypothetical protein